MKQEDMPYVTLERYDGWDGAGIVPDYELEQRFPTTGACMTFLHNVVVRTLDATPGAFVQMELRGNDLIYQCMTDREYLFEAVLYNPSSNLPPLVKPKSRRVIKKNINKE